MPARQTRRARAARRRQRRMRQAVHDLAPEEWSALLAEWGGCAYCGSHDGPFQRDCVLPISRGGRYTRDNVVPACRACNASKCNSEVTEWMQRKKLDEPTFLLRYAEVCRKLAAAPPVLGAAAAVEQGTEPMTTRSTADDSSG